MRNYYGKTFISKPITVKFNLQQEYRKNEIITLFIKYMSKYRGVYIFYVIKTEMTSWF